jgi:PadR family transcriptional regulator, regulatory protein AphA
MHTELHSFSGVTVLEVKSMHPQGIASEKDAVVLVGLCGENGTNRLLLHAKDLSPDFFDLSTRLAGEILLKFSTYRIQAALVAGPELTRRGKFPEFMLETNRGPAFRVFSERQPALDWLSRP